MSDRPGALQAARLAQALRDAELDWEIVPRTGSTNADLLARARERAPARPLLRAADAQSAGRGRLGRSWQATPGGALLFSVALPWRGAPAASAAVTLACALAVAQCLEQAGVVVQLKWPNDLLLGGRKLAGMLTELAEDRQGARSLVIGLGLNVFVDAAQRAAIGLPVAELAEALGRAAVEAAREDWLARLALALIGAAQRYEREGLAPSVAGFEQRCAWRGETVQLAVPGQPGVAGVLLGIDGAGALRLRSGDRILTIISGEMSMRKPGPSTLPVPAHPGARP
jgi:BirA family biotin operon repressor/biotin-[acetyl-CoA-carboxylase] ligase